MVKVSSSIFALDIKTKSVSLILAITVSQICGIPAQSQSINLSPRGSKRTKSMYETFGVSGILPWEAAPAITDFVTHDITSEHRLQKEAELLDLMANNGKDHSPSEINSSLLQYGLAATIKLMGGLKQGAPDVETVERYIREWGLEGTIRFLHDRNNNKPVFSPEREIMLELEGNLDAYRATKPSGGLKLSVPDNDPLANANSAVRNTEKARQETSYRKNESHKEFPTAQYKGNSDHTVKPKWAEGPVSLGPQYALFFSVDKNEAGWPPLGNCYSDCVELAEELIKNYGYLRQNVEICRDFTDEEITNKITEYLARPFPSPSSQLLIYFSGHGDFDPVCSEGFLVAKNSAYGAKSRDTYVPVISLVNRINHISCKHILVLFDTCHSGAFMDWLSSAWEVSYKGEKKEVPVEPSKDRPVEQVISLYQDKPTRVILTSTDADLALAGKRGQHSPFTSALLELFGQYPKYFLLSDLESQIGKRTKGRRLTFPGNKDGSNFIFVFKARRDPSE